MLISCINDKKELTTVSPVDLEKYSGTWYEIARLPNRFEKGLECVTATYTLRNDGKIEVLNKGRKTGELNKISKIKGVAWVPDREFPGRLKVRFFWPFSGKYYILELDKNYRYALVGEPSRKYLWVLSKDKHLDNDIFKLLLEKAAGYGFETARVIKINQDCR
ncbi:MAG: lipocalin family protein [Bacteroidales bacterium]|nr:MAG: lipocalin family protein [Bacteroidales bacterium]